MLLLLATISFVMMRLAPGGPFDGGDRGLDARTREALHQRYGLDRPLPAQYVRFIAGLARGDLGPSYADRGRQVSDIIVDVLPASLLLGGLALILALAIGLPAGILAALRRGTSADAGLMSLALLGLSVPAFVVGPLLQWFFALRLDWLPVAEYGRGLLTPQHRTGDFRRIRQVAQPGFFDNHARTGKPFAQLAL